MADSVQGAHISDSLRKIGKILIQASDSIRWLGLTHNRFCATSAHEATRCTKSATRSSALLSWAPIETKGKYWSYSISYILPYIGETRHLILPRALSLPSPLIAAAAAGATTIE